MLEKNSRIQRIARKMIKAIHDLSDHYRTGEVSMPDTDTSKMSEIIEADNVDYD